MAYLGTKPANQVIDSTLIADGTITTSDLANGAVSPAKLDTNAQYMGFKNRIINGAMQVWQRGTSITVSGSDTYTADRWVGIAAGANYTASPASNTIFGITQNSLVINGAAGNTLCDIAQRIEAVNAYDLAGSVCTVSANLYTTDGTNITWEAYSANSTNVFSSKTLIATGTLSTPAGSYVARTFSFTASSAVSNGLEIRFKFGALLSGKQGAIGAVQLEKGATATSFDYRSFGTELALCQRYYEVIGATIGGVGDYGSIWSQPLNTFSNCWTPVRFAVPKRIGGYTFGLTSAGNWVSSTPTIYSGSAEAIIFQANNLYYLQASAGTAANTPLAFVSAEL
jgi:hypothetical protein